jgi:hypothetical protein
MVEGSAGVEIRLVVVLQRGMTKRRHLGYRLDDEGNRSQGRGRHDQSLANIG